jgi:Amt family ammonium transporter
MGCVMLGPRAGCRAVNGLQIPPLHNRVVIGTVILLSLWLAENTPLAVNATLSTSTGALGALMCLRLRGMPANVPTACWGLLAGAAAIAGPCEFVDGIGAAIIGGVAGILCVLSISFWERVGVDDATGAISVFGTSGIWGVVAVGLFASGHSDQGWNGVIRPAFVEKYGSDGVRGLFYGDPSQLAAQLLAAGVLILFGLIMAFAWFRLSNWMVPMRASNEGQIGMP